MKKSIVRVTLVLAVALLVVYAFTRELSHVNTLHQENERIKRKIKELEIANKELREKIEIIKKDKLYIEKIAREELGMIKQGEKIYRFKE
jgi:cell division protein FtsB